MALMSDLDIRRALGKDIVIEPFLQTSLSPVGYDFTVGDFVFSLQEGLLEAKNGIYEVPARNTVQILTREALWVSSRIGGTLHSKVSLASQGFSHVSTTLDPGWKGPLLVTITNNTDGKLLLKANDTFVTLIFFKVATPTNTPHDRPSFREDILLHQLATQTNSYIQKIAATLGNRQGFAKFEQQVRQADRTLLGKILSSVRSAERREVLRIVTILILVVLVLLTGSLQFYWDNIKWLFGNVNYDSGFLGAQVAFITLLFLLIQELRRKTTR